MLLKSGNQTNCWNIAYILPGGRRKREWRNQITPKITLTKYFNKTLWNTTSSCRDEQPRAGLLALAAPLGNTERWLLRERQGRCDVSMFSSINPFRSVHF